MNSQYRLGDPATNGQLWELRHFSKRELEVLRLVSIGMTNADIARVLHISQNTVARPVQSILAKSGTANRAEAAVLATEHRLIDADDATHE